MTKLKIFCVTNEQKKYLEKLPLILAGVGNKKFSKKYLSCLKGKNIQHKEQHYSELTFHYWYWKNKLKNENKNTWIGFSQKRRFWVKNNKKIRTFEDLKKNILVKVPNSWKKYESVICKPIFVQNPKKMKLLKRGWKNILKDPSVLTNKGKQNIELQFDMHHGYKILDKSIDCLNKEDKLLFKKFIKQETKFNPHIMFISKKNILNKWFKDLFAWLFKCEKLFGTKNLKGYDQKRLYAYLAERYLSYWFQKNTKYLESDWIFFEKK
tara:strand:- start:229 stop:1026 length:798 start_codon:yes stop_codon:yes gene_type:complete